MERIIYFDIPIDTMSLKISKYEIYQMFSSFNTHCNTYMYIVCGEPRGKISY